VDEQHRERVALFRYGVIAELVNGPLKKGEKEKHIARLSQKEWVIPGTNRTQLSRSTLRDWTYLYQSMGLDGLKPRPRRDSGQSRAIPGPVLDLLLALRRERPRASVHSLVRAARLAGGVPADVHLAPSTVHRALAAHGMPGLPANNAEPDARAFTFPHANDLWTSDVMHGPRLLTPGRRDGGKTYLVAFLDDATRMVPFAAFYASEGAGCFQDAFKQGLLRRGIPRRLYCDNGSTYKTHHLDLVCATLGIVLVHSRPHHPRGRGKIERFFRTVRSAFLPHVAPEMLADLGALNRVFWAWLEAEYHHTVHGGLDGKTPLDRLVEDRALTRPAPDDLDALMRMRVTRKVGRDRVIRLDKRLYEAPDGFAGETVEVRYDPYDPSRPVHFTRKGETTEIPLRRLDLHGNALVMRERERVRDGVTDPPPATGISYLELVASGFYGKKEEK
jgi:transposase InsO family protein